MESKKKHSIDEKILSTFWDLVETDEEKRIAATEVLLTALIEKQGDNKTEPCAEINYAVKRLIKGLASNRGCARLGYAAALEQILKRFNFFTIPQLLQLVKENLKYEKSDAKSDISQVLIGKLTAFDSIVRVFSVKEMERSQLVQLIKTVLAVGEKKSFLGSLTLEILYEIMSKFDKHEFRESIWPLIEDQMCQGWLLEAMATEDKKSGIREGSELLLAWATMDIISGTDRRSEEKQPHNMEARRKWALSTLTSLASQASNTDPKWQLHLLQFFVLAGFFETKSPSSLLPHCEKPFATPVSPEMCSLLQGSLLKALSKLADSNSGKASSVKPFTELLFNVSSYIQLLLENRDGISVTADLPEEDLERWTKIHRTVKKIHSQDDKERSSVHQAFELLLLHQGLLIFFDRDDPRENLDEIQNCYKRAFAKKNKSAKNKSSVAEPMWIDVLMDVLMHLLLQESHLTRNIVKMASSLLHSEFTLNSIQLITQVLDSPTGSDMAFEDDDEEGTGDEDAEDKDANSDEDGDGDDVEETDKEGLEDSTLIDPATKDAIKAALGEAAIPSDAEESLSDLDDDAMMKLDEMSAVILRQRNEKFEKKKEQKEQETQLRHYKLRCLDLVEDVARHTDSAAMLFELIMPLLKLMKMGRERQEFQEISGRSRRILHEICQRHKLKNDKTLSSEELQKVVGNIQNMMKGTGAILSKDVSNACLFLVRLAFGHVDNASENNGHDVPLDENQNESVVCTLILEFFKHKNSKMQPLFLRMLVEKYTSVVWPLREELLNYVLSTDVRVFHRTNASMLLAAMITPKTVKELESPNQDFTEKVIKGITNVLVAADANEMKQKFIEQVLLLLNQAISVGKTCLEMPENFTERIACLRKISRDVRKQCNRLIGLFQKKSSAKKNDKKRKMSVKKEKSKKPRL